MLLDRFVGMVITQGFTIDDYPLNDRIAELWTLFGYSYYFSLN